MKKLSTGTTSAIKSWSSVAVKASVAMDVVTDGLMADGVVPADLKAPGKGEDRALFDSMKDAIVAGFSADARRLLNEDVKTLSEANKAKRTYWQQQIGSRMKDLRRGLTRRIAKEGAKKGARTPATLEARALEAAAKFKKQFQSAESPAADVTKVIKALDALMSLLVAAAPESKKKK
jgi:hypothetical protein